MSEMQKTQPFCKSIQNKIPNRDKPDKRPVRTVTVDDTEEQDLLYVDAIITGNVAESNGQSNPNPTQTLMLVHHNRL